MKSWDDAISRCVANGGRILDDAGYLWEYGRFPSARVLGILAQEEFAKAYLLKLVDEGAIPLCDEVLRACRDHSCKHLIALVMIHLFTPIEDMLSRNKRAREACGDGALPPHVADALNIFCHEKLRRWRSKNWFWAENPSYDQTAKNIGEGSLDRVKQNALYVGIGRNGVTSTPHCTAAEAHETLETAKMLKEVVEGGGAFAFIENEHITTALRAMLHELKDQRGINEE
jgi:AbiV family abortive infection protein